MSAAVLSDDLKRWIADAWTHRLIIYALVVITISLIVQIIATVFIGRL